MGEDVDGLIRKAMRDSGLELSLEFNRSASGVKSGAIVFKDEAGAPIARIPLASPEAMNVALARLVLLGFESVEESLRLEPAGPAEPTPRAKVEASVLVAGVDG